ncbi:MAG: type I DNA topoisomerase [Candidatus Cloacimonetes bacterium]|nr:type I DNA topoisomerase [Candidatus Cloacimonadota bacterium]
MSKLVIVESPTKAKTLSKFLGKEYEVKSSKGHIRDLPKSELGVDVKHNFTPSYEIMPGKNKVVLELKKAAKDAAQIYLATDLDREGEAIAAHTVAVLGGSEGKKEKVKSKKFNRITFHEITKDAILAAFKNPRCIDLNLFDAYQARRVLDRLVGYKLSPLLWKKIRYGLSAGRVQSVAVRLIVEREREREKFKSEGYWTVEAELTKFTGSRRVPHSADRGATLIAKDFRSPLCPRSAPADDTKFPSNSHSRPADVRGMGTSPASFCANLVSRNDKPYETVIKIPLFAGEYQSKKTSIVSEKQANKIIHDIKNKTFVVSEIEKKEVKRNPYPPFTTASLQRTAANYLGFSAKRTMRAAQHLYEEGYITYHRTDSTNLAEEFLIKCREYLKKQFGEQFIPKTANRYQTKVKSAQEAHEAVRPTKLAANLKSQISNLKKELGSDELKLYELIWKRALASQMVAAVFDQVRVDITAGPYLFRATGGTVKFLGWMKINEKLKMKNEKLEEKEGSVSIPELKVGEKLQLVRLIPSEHTTPPPPRYTEASLIHDLEKYGIGRPSTYAPIISTIQERNYVVKEEKYFRPEDVGIVVNDLLVEHFPEIVDLRFTASMEDDLDEIAKGEKKWVPLIREFYEPFAKKLLIKSLALDKADITTLAETNERCPECGRGLVVKLGKYGKFLSCAGFPECKYGRPFEDKDHDGEPDEVDKSQLRGVCPKCGGELILKEGRFGKFIACPNYPKCKFTKQYLDKIGLSCPECGQGEVIVKRTRRGKIFYGCSRYPDCKYASWTKPKEIV